MNGFRELLAVLLNNADGLRKFTVSSAEGLLCVGTEGKGVLVWAGSRFREGAAPWDGGGEHVGWVGCDPAKLIKQAE